MSRVLAFATDKEFRAALGPLGAGSPPAPGEWTPLPAGAFGRGWLGLVTGVGLVNAALSLGRVLASVEAEGILCMGIAGSFDLDRAGLGDILLVEREIWPEYGVWTPQGPDPLAIAFPLARVGGKDIFSEVETGTERTLEAMGLAVPDWPRAVSLSVSTVTAHAEETARLTARHAPSGGILLENMEGFALALGCAGSGVPFAEVRAVSNLAGSRLREHWNLKGGLAALGLAAKNLFGSF